MQQGYQENNSQNIIDRLSPIKPYIPDLKDGALRLYLVNRSGLCKRLANGDEFPVCRDYEAKSEADVRAILANRK